MGVKILVLEFGSIRNKTAKRQVHTINRFFPRPKNRSAPACLVCTVSDEVGLGAQRDAFMAGTAFLRN